MLHGRALLLWRLLLLRLMRRLLVRLRVEAARQALSDGSGGDRSHPLLLRGDRNHPLLLPLRVEAARQEALRHGGGDDRRHPLVGGVYDLELYL